MYLSHSLAQAAIYLWSAPTTFGLTLPRIPVSITTKQLVDHDRYDPFAPTKTRRSVMISIFDPVPSNSCNWSTTAYIPPLTASILDETLAAQYGIPSGLLGSLSMETCSHNGTTSWQSGRDSRPVVVFSHGLGASRFMYSLMAASIASAGDFVVVTVDHPYDAAVVEFPSHKLIYGLNGTAEPPIPDMVDVRVKDLAFVLKEIAPGHKKAAVAGHSLGGASAVAELISRYDRAEAFRGALDLDGSLYGPVVATGTEKPVLIFGHKGNATDPSWDAIWPRLTGWKHHLMLNGSEHFTFSDFPVIADVLFGGGPVPPKFQPLLGTINGVRAIDIIVKFSVTFFNKILRGKGDGVLSGPSKDFPEVQFVR